MDSQGSVELREDVPLKAAGSSGGNSGGWCDGGARAIAAAFGALSAAITVALLAQLYTGHYEWGAGGGAHGAVSTGAGVCSRAGTSALQVGGRAMDAAVAAALCLAVVSPHLTSLDASGSILFWEYRVWHAQAPLLAEWGAGGNSTGAGGSMPGADGAQPPRLVAALAALHAKLGTAPWPPLLQPAIDVASLGFTVSPGLAAARGVPALAGTTQTAPALAAYLRSLQRNSSAELSAKWSGGGVSWSAPAVASLAGGAWRLFAGGAGVGPALAAVEAVLPVAADVNDTDTVVAKVVKRLIAASSDGTWPPAGSGSSVAGIAVVDAADNYVALVSGLSTPFGSGEVTADGWKHDEPTALLDFAPGILAERSTCGSRYVIGGEGSAALAQGVAAITAEGQSGAEVARSFVRGSSPSPDNVRALNYVWQKADALISHADIRSGGLASRF